MIPIKMNAVILTQLNARTDQSLSFRRQNSMLLSLKEKSIFLGPNPPGDPWP